MVLFLKPPILEFFENIVLNFLVPKHHPGAGGAAPSPSSATVASLEKIWRSSAAEGGESSTTVAEMKSELYLDHATPQADKDQMQI